MDKIKPSYYNEPRAGLTCDEVIASITEPCIGQEAMWIGNTTKYLWRWKFKNGVEDLKKAKRCLGILIDKLEGGQQ